MTVEPLRDQLLDFAHVLELELREIDLRRANSEPPQPTRTAESTASSGESSANATVVPPPPDPEVTPATPESPEGFAERQYSRALNRDLLGVAFSGGGIRSATFNLGVLQGLAQLDLLKKIDFLSSVSGGGWIAAWLAAWIQRDGDMENVRRQLCVNRAQQAQAHREFPPRQERTYKSSPAQVTQDVEPYPIKHLRRYSNFLAPRPGVRSTDSWNLISQYVRNLLLNQMVILPTVLAVIMLILLMGMGAKALESSRGVNSAAVIADWVTCIAAGCATFSSVWVAVWLLIALAGVRNEISPKDRNRQSRPPSAADARQLTVALVMLLVCLTGLVIVMLRFSQAIHNALTIGGGLPALIALGGIVHSFLIAGSWRDYGIAVLRLFWFIHTPRRVEAATTVLSGIAAGTTGAAFLALVALEIHNYRSQPLCVAAFGVPALLFGFFLMESVQIGLLGTIQRARVREWWSMFQARVLLIAVCWMVAWFLVICAPRLISLGTAYWIGTFSTLGWITTTATALGISYIPTPKRRPSRFRLLAEIGAGVFLAGLVVCLSYGTYRVLPYADSNTNGTGNSPTSPVLAIALAPDQNTPLVPQPDQLSNATRQVQNALGNIKQELQRVSDALPMMSSKATGYEIIDWSRMLDPSGDRLQILLYGFLGCLFLMLVAGAMIDVNVFSLHELYTLRLVRCYLAASRIPYEDEPGQAPFVVPSYCPQREKPVKPAFSLSNAPEAELEPEMLFRLPNPLTGMAPGDDPYLYRLRPGLGYDGPLHLFNAAVNLARGHELSWQERMADSFVMSPLYCGSSTTGYRPVVTGCSHGPDCPLGPRCEESNWYAYGIRLSRAMSISGAAISSSMGFYSSPAITALLTVFNLRLGQWLGNPHSVTHWTSRGPTDGWGYMLKECLGLMRGSHDEPYVYLTDGGHFDNLGVYELIRRRCRIIVAFDAGADSDGEMQELALLMRRIRTDFGIRIDIKTSRLIPSGDKHTSHGHIAVGRICYSDRHKGGGQQELEPQESDAFNQPWQDGILLYIKPVLSGDETVDIASYRKRHPEFPHQSTLDQYFSESQFESYRALGFHSVMAAFADTFSATVQNTGDSAVPPHPFGSTAASSPPNAGTWAGFKAVYDRFRPEPSLGYLEKYARLNQAYVAIQRQLQSNALLHHISLEFQACADNPLLRRPHRTTILSAEAQQAELHLLAEVMTMMEDVFFALELADYRQSASSGWIAVLRHWINTSAFERQWLRIQTEFSPEFVEYVARHEARLFLPENR